MKVAFTGATGTVGKALVTALVGRGDQVVVLTRDPAGAKRKLGAGVEAFAWTHPKLEPAPNEGLEGCDGVIHLLGEPVAQRWSEEVKHEIHSSRVLGTRNLIEGLKLCDRRPPVLVAQSATGWYGACDERPLDETAPPADDFLAQVVVDWEQEAAGAEALGMRVVLARTGVVLTGDGGALKTMLPPFKAGIGGPVAGGEQYVPWIGLADEVAALIFLLDNDSVTGPVNLTAPNPATNGELSKALGKVLKRPAVAPVPEFAIKLLYGEMAQIVVTGANVVPKRLQELGFGFTHPELEPALRAVLGK